MCGKVAANPHPFLSEGKYVGYKRPLSCPHPQRERDLCPFGGLDVHKSRFGQFGKRKISCFYWESNHDFLVVRPLI